MVQYYRTDEVEGDRHLQPDHPPVAGARDRPRYCVVRGRVEECRRLRPLQEWRRRHAHLRPLEPLTGDGELLPHGRRRPGTTASDDSVLSHRRTGDVPRRRVQVLPIRRALRSMGGATLEEAVTVVATDQALRGKIHERLGRNARPTTAQTHTIRAAYAT